ncbi:MAG: arginase family protein [Acidobacteria bacterium]|nr:arginase family protein [Acidobacteriota bacterium]
MDRSRVPHLRPPPSLEAPAFRDPDVLRASEWLARASADPAAVVIGVPFGGGSISRARCDLAPAAVRRALGRFTVWSSDFEVSLEDFPALDAGDVEPGAEVEKTQARVEEALRAVRAQTGAPMCVGCARGAGADALLTFDAHHDCRDPARGATNGTAVRQLVGGGLERVVQVGIHGFANAEPLARWAVEHGVVWIPPSAVRDQGVEEAIARALGPLEGAGRIWVDVDLDVLDRAFAPGAPAALPGGLWPADLERAAFILGRDRRVAGCDIVEYDPTIDVAEATARAACAVLLAFLAGVAAR